MSSKKIQIPSVGKRTQVPAQKAKAFTDRNQSEEEPKMVTTTFRITEEQHKALRLEAVSRAVGGKRPDASALLREILDEWLKGAWN